MAELWGINVKIVNNTDYDIAITGAEIDPLTIFASNIVEWTEIGKSVAFNTDFSTSAITSYMNGSVLWNSTDGMVVNRGDLATQNISMEIFVNGMSEFSQTQTTNGVVTVCTWDDIIDGGNLTLTFNAVS